MIEEGEEAPPFTLPAVSGDERTEIALDDFFGDSVVVLAFYPGDFNPACSGTTTGLDELDLFTMQKDVAVLAISGDSIHSHRAFAEQYSLQMPLLSDTDGSVADEYGVRTAQSDAGYLTDRAVVVVDHTGTVQFAWSSEEPTAIPAGEEIREAVASIGDDETAESRYRVGHAHYIEGRRAFTSAMNAYQEREWMLARTDFTQATTEFEQARQEFDTAVRFAESGVERVFERAEQKAEALWRASDWLADSAGAFASGEGANGESLRSDAETPLETARELDEPPDPGSFPLEDSAGTAETPEPTTADSELASDIDAAVAASTEEGSRTAAATDEANGTSHAEQAETRTEEQTVGTDSEGGETTAPPPESTAQQEGEIDDEELEAITAELEEQTEQAEQETVDPEPDGVVPDAIDTGSADAAGPGSSGMDRDEEAERVDERGNAGDGGDTAQEDASEDRDTAQEGNASEEDTSEDGRRDTIDRSGELDLTDPTAQADEDEESDGDGSGDETAEIDDAAEGYDVPDSL